MLRNYLLIALRSLRRQSVNSVINLAGLAMGMACSLVIMLYVYAEWSYDRHYKDANRIYRIGISFFNIGNFALGPEALGEFLPKEFEGIDAFTRVYRDPAMQIQVGDKVNSELVYFTDTEYFKVFSHEFIEGDPTNALKSPKSAVVTRSMGKLLLGEGNPMGKTLLLDKEKTPFTITGVVNDDPRSSSLKAKIWASNEELLTRDLTWTSAGSYNFVKLKENNSQGDLVAALDRLLEKQVYPHASGVPSGISFEDYKKNDNSVKFFVHPLTEIHLQSKLNYEISPTGNQSNLMIFAGISFIILILAAINFINLTTAQGAQRAKEIGVRKTMGASRTKLIFQFLLESIAVCLVALPLSLLLCEFFIRLFEWVTDEQLINAIWLNYWGIAGLLFFVLAVGLASGMYPALILTGFKPSLVLKGRGPAMNSGGLRDVLVGFQLAISVGLTVVTLTIASQMNYMKVKDLGFDQGQVVTIDQINHLGKKADAFNEAIKSLPGIKLTSLHSGEPGSKSIMSFQTFKSEKMESELTINTYFGDPDFIPLMGFRIIKGRGFNPDLQSDSASIVLNESAVKALQLDEPIGAVLNGDQKVIGVVSDFHWESLRNHIAPVAITLKDHYYQLAARITSSNPDLIPQLGQKWKEYSDEPFEYHFLDENFSVILKKEKVLESAISFFSLLAMLISCMGLYGLSALTTLQRTKEIGIRKTLGASIADILLLLNKKLVWLLAGAVLVGIPIAYYAVDGWLSGFAYHITPGPSVFIISVLLSAFMAWVAVAYHVYRATSINPADSLKYE